MSSKADPRRSRIPGVPDSPKPVTDTAMDFEPAEPSEPETDPDGAATGDGGDGYPVPGSGFASE